MGARLVRILLVDPQAMTRAGVRSLLGGMGEVEIVAESGDVVEALQLLERLQPDLLISELDEPGFAGLELIRKAAAGVDRLRVLALTAQEGQAAVEAALRSGATGFVSKNSTPSELVKAVHALRTGRSYLSPAVTEHVVSALSAPGRETRCITKREREVLQLVAEGLSTKEIAVRIGISPRTVESHRASLMAKVGTHKACELVRIAIRDGFVDP
jgi:DNA-binding NarL/FixJ family response regulator